MTTAWSHLAHGQPIAALRTHATGTLLAVAASLIGAGCVALATLGKRPAWWPPERAAAVAAVGMAAMVFVEWGLRIGSWR